MLAAAWPGNGSAWVLLDLLPDIDVDNIVDYVYIERKRRK
jgi:hypothetical protein